MIYRLACAITVSAITEVEASSLDEAIAIAEERDAGVGGRRSGVNADEMWVIDEVDGSPTGIHVA